MKARTIITILFWLGVAAVAYCGYTVAVEEVAKDPNAVVGIAGVAAFCGYAFAK